MSHKGVLLPVLQNWSCHNCGGCCREHQIVITDAEKQRIEQLAWTSEHGKPSDRPAVVGIGGAWRLNHQDDGACVFLNEQGLCRIHAAFGEEAKPLACRAYPYAIHPAGISVTTSLRFSCPSVVQNLGIPVVQQRPSIEGLAKEIVPAGYTSPDAPALTSERPLTWPDFVRIQAFLERGLSDGRVPMITRLIRILAWLDLLEKAGRSVPTGDHLGQLLAVLYETAERAFPNDLVPVEAPSRIARMMFRQLIAQLVRHDTSVTAAEGVRGRLRLLVEGLRFTAGRGRVPAIPEPVSVRVAFGKQSSAGNDACRPRFSELETEFQGRQSEFDELFSRYFRVKVQGIHFCGRANYDMSLIDGFRSLALMYPATLWVARLRAATVRRGTLILQDVQAALAVLDHNYGYSPALGLRASRQRISQLAGMHQLTPLCTWYSR